MDVCILAGCDYCETIRGVAATTAFKDVKKHGDLAAVVAKYEKEKIPEGVDYVEVRYLVRSESTDGRMRRLVSRAPEPSRTPHYPLTHYRYPRHHPPSHTRVPHCMQVKKLFISPEVTPASELDLKWNDPDEAGLMDFLVKEKVRGTSARSRCTR